MAGLGVPLSADLHQVAEEGAEHDREGQLRQPAPPVELERPLEQERGGQRQQREDRELHEGEADGVALSGVAADGDDLKGEEQGAQDRQGLPSAEGAR